MKHEIQSIMSRLLLCFSFIMLFSTFNFAQKDYFQQEVNTIIKVRLDDQSHSLSGNIFIEYTNNATVSLDTIYLHLWANAFKSKNSEFAKQKLRNKDSRFYFTDEHNMGGYDTLAFKVNGSPAKWSYHPNYNDVCFVLLNGALKPSESITISTPFKIKIPTQFSRFGYEKSTKRNTGTEQSYQITQWFPKPAVFDRNGWHPMPYLDMGEFYSEFGDYDVTISLPEDYIVAGTGELLTRSELDRVKERVNYTKEIFDSNIVSPAFGPASDNYKTIRFIAENVHDFAWFANRRFLILEGEIQKKDKTAIKSQVFFLPEDREKWKPSLEFLESGTKFYSEHVSEYPYPKVAVVQGPLSAGGGMEYPMITIISNNSGGKSLDEVITHEIGHNWFYGILAFNEREHPWLDEGINSYYDNRHMLNRYKREPVEIPLPKVIKKGFNVEFQKLYHEFANIKAMTQPSDLHSTDFTMFNYFLGAYENPDIAFSYLESYLISKGYELDQIIQSFYKEWAFKHPGPEDLIRHFESTTNLDLSWFFKGLIGDTRSFDYGIKKLSKEGDSISLEIVNHTKHAIPFTLTSSSKDSILSLKMIDGFVGSKTFKMDVKDIHKFSLDHQKSYPDKNRHNNYIRTKGMFKKLEPISLGFFDVIDDPEKTQIGWLPAMGWNKSDGFMLGFMLFNHSIPNKSFQYVINPGNILLAPFVDKPLVGQANFSYDWYQNKTIRNVKASLGVRSFHLEFTPEKQLRYFRVKPSIEFQFNRVLNNQHYYVLNLDNYWTGQETFTSETDKSIKYGLFNRISFERKDSRILNPLNGKIEFEIGNYDHFSDTKENYGKISATLSTYFRYAMQKKIDFRIYGAGFLWHSNSQGLGQPGTLGLIGFAQNDYLFDDYFLDRGAQHSVFSKQINLTGGGFKNAVDPLYGLGQSNQFIAAMNIKADLPINVPVVNSIKPYFDAGVYGYLPAFGQEYESRVLYSGGLVLESFEGILNLYVPLINSDAINEIYAQEPDFIRRISFSLNLRFFDFTKLLDRYDLIFQQ